MLQKTDDTEVKELIEMAKTLIDHSYKKNENICYVPYIDNCVDEIRYLKFILVNNRWNYEGELIKA